MVQCKLSSGSLESSGEAHGDAGKGAREKIRGQREVWGKGLITARRFSASHPSSPRPLLHAFRETDSSSSTGKTSWAAIEMAVDDIPIQRTQCGERGSGRVDDLEVDSG